MFDVYLILINLLVVFIVSIFNVVGKKKKIHYIVDSLNS